MTEGKKDKIVDYLLIGGVILGGLLLITSIILGIVFKKKDSSKVNEVSVDISEMKVAVNGDNSDIKVYTQDDYESFLTDYKDKKLPDIYVTEFLFDGAGMYKTYDLDDFTEKGNDIEVKALNLKVFNVNTTGDVSFTGEIKGGAIAVDTNDIDGDINIILNNVKVDTDSKKIPAVMVYNKDITYDKHKVTIKALKDTKNYLEGGKLKKVSLIPTEDLSNYTNKYSGDASTWYKDYTNYYGVYSSDEVNKVLFAKITADNEDLKDGDPYYFYKGAGAISSDIDLYFEGEGYLEVTSKNKEGIESKGNITFSGSTGDYVIYAEDDCLNTTTESNGNVHNTLTIDVNSLYAIVSNDADEGDAIDSNGELIINNGLVVAIAKSGQDAGIDSTKGTYINGGTVLATGDMYDEIKSDSKQKFVVLGFNEKMDTDSNIIMVDEDNKAVFAYKTDRLYSYLVYSSSSLEDKTYSLYKNAIIGGVTNNGYYIQIDAFTDGTQLGYASTGNMGGAMPGGEQGGERPEMSNGEQPNMQNGERPEMPNGEQPGMQNGVPQGMPTNGNTIASNGEFTLSGIANLFNGVATLTK